MTSPSARAAARPLAATFGAVARLRGARTFHPRGTASEALLTITPGPHPLGGLAGEHRAVVRTSRAVGLPSPVPDIWGIAIRFVDLVAELPADEPGGRAPVDVLLATTGEGAVGRHVLVPARRPATSFFSSLLPFATPTGQRFAIGARPRVGDGDEPDDVIDLLTAEPGRPWRSVGEVVLGDQLPMEQGQALRFSPWRTPAEFRLAGWCNDLRRPTYRASQRARPDTGAPTPGTPDATAVGREGP